MLVYKKIDWDAIKTQKQKAIQKNNKKKNSKRIDHTYEKGDWILIKKPGIIKKLAVLQHGPFQVIKHRTNGIVVYKKREFSQ